MAPTAAAAGGERAIPKRWVGYLAARVGDPRRSDRRPGGLPVRGHRRQAHVHGPRRCLGARLGSPTDPRAPSGTPGRPRFGRRAGVVVHHVQYASIAGLDRHRPRARLRVLRPRQAAQIVGRARSRADRTSSSGGEPGRAGPARSSRLSASPARPRAAAKPSSSRLNRTGRSAIGTWPVRSKTSSREPLIRWCYPSASAGGTTWSCAPQTIRLGTSTSSRRSRIVVAGEAPRGPRRRTARARRRRRAPRAARGAARPGCGRRPRDRARARGGETRGSER